MTVRSEATSYLGDLWRYARVLTGNDADADDLLQESLTRAISSSRSYDPSRPLLQWLLKIVRNTFITGVTRARADVRNVEEYSKTVGIWAPPVQEESAELMAVRRAIAALPVEQAEILHLVGVLELTYAESAALLQVPVGTVMSRLSRARCSLRLSLEQGAQKRAVLKIVGGKDGTRAG